MSVFHTDDSGSIPDWRIAFLAQLVERCSCKAEVESSILSGGIARLAQWIERQTSNLEVAGSIPASGCGFMVIFREVPVISVRFRVNPLKLNVLPSSLLLHHGS